MESTTSFFDALVHERSAYNRLLRQQLVAAVTVTVAVPLMSFFVILPAALQERHESQHSESTGEIVLSAARLATTPLPRGDIALPLLAVTATIVVVIALQNRSGARHNATGEVAGTVLSTCASLAGFLTSLASGLWIFKSVNAIIFHEQIAKIGDVTIAIMVMVAGAALAALSRNGLDVYAVSVKRSADRLDRLLSWHFPVSRVDTFVAAGAVVAYVGLLLNLAILTRTGTLLTAPIEAAGPAIAVAGLVGLVWSGCVCWLLPPLPSQDGSLLDLLDDSLPVPSPVILIPIGAGAMLILTGGLIWGSFSVATAASVSISIVSGATALGLLSARARFIDRTANGRLDREREVRADTERATLGRALDELATEDEGLSNAAFLKYGWLLGDVSPKSADQLDVQDGSLG